MKLNRNLDGEIVAIENEPTSCLSTFMGRLFGHKIKTITLEIKQQVADKISQTKFKQIVVCGRCGLEFD
jgi:hypothetical protein